MNNNRRKFLKLVLIGGTSLVVGKIFGPFISKFLDGSPNVDHSSAFRIAEDKQSLFVYDDSGEEVLQIDKTG